VLTECPFMLLTTPGSISVAAQYIFAIMLVFIGPRIGAEGTG
jgi:hypothetical protein